MSEWPINLGTPVSLIPVTQKAAYYYTTAIPTIGVFGLGLNRLPTLVGGTIYFVV